VAVGAFEVVQFDEVVAVFGLQHVVVHFWCFSFGFFVEELVVDVLAGQGEADAVLFEVGQDAGLLALNDFDLGGGRGTSTLP
jgi:hypothetical protein